MLPIILPPYFFFRILKPLNGIVVNSCFFQLRQAELVNLMFQKAFTLIKPCPFKHKTVLRHVWKDYEELADDARYTPEYKDLYAKRKETIERVFADAKEKHGMRYTHYRGLTQLSKWVRLKFAAMNLKKYAIHKWHLCDYSPTTGLLVFALLSLNFKPHFLGGNGVFLQSAIYLSIEIFCCIIY